MDVEIFCLCDAATVHSGKMNILGAFDHVTGSSEPLKSAPCCIAIRIRFGQIEAGKKDVRIQFVDADGSQVVPTIKASLGVNPPPTESSAVANFVVQLQRLQLPRFGEYSIALAVDGRAEASIPLFARRSPPSASSAKS